MMDFDYNSIEGKMQSMISEQAARIAALEAEIARLKRTMQLHAGDCLSLDNEVTLMRDHWQEAEERAAAARADALEEAARVAEAAYEGTYGWQIAAAIRALALTQPASTQPLTDQGETSTAGEVAPKDSEYKYPGSDWYRDNVGGGVEP